MRVVSWNVNGLRACVRKGFLDWLDETQPTLVALQEVRALPDEAQNALQLGPEWSMEFMPAQRRGYSGVAILSRLPISRTIDRLAPRFDREGRFLVVQIGRLAVCSAYFPKGDGPGRDLSRIPYKLDFYRAARKRLDALRRSGSRVLCVGDFNTAHHAIDLARPRQNSKNSGFRPEERRAFDAWTDGGWVDTYRQLHPDGSEYSWWSQRSGVRERNVGWRIDYVLASKAASRYVRAAFISTHVRGSDHCPVGVELDDAVLR